MSYFPVRHVPRTFLSSAVHQTRQNRKFVALRANQAGSFSAFMETDPKWNPRRFLTEDIFLTDRPQIDDEREED